MCRLGFRHAIVRSRCNLSKAISARFERPGYFGEVMWRRLVVGRARVRSTEYRVREACFDTTSSLASSRFESKGGTAKIYAQLFDFTFRPGCTQRTYVEQGDFKSHCMLRWSKSSALIAENV